MQPNKRVDEVCPCCGDDSNPIDPDDGLCWACQPCRCGQACGFASGLNGEMGYKTCEV